MANELKELLAKRAELSSEHEEKRKAHDDWFEDYEHRLLGILQAIADHVEADTPKPAQKKRTAPKKPKQPDHDKVAKVYADFEPCPTGCLCGCGEDVAEGASFVRGHQHKLRSIAMAVHACKLDADKLSDAGMAYAVVQNWMGSGAE